MSTQRRETALKTRGCTDKSPKVLVGFTVASTIAALEDFYWTICIHKLKLSLAVFFLLCVLALFCCPLPLFILQTYHLPCSTWQNGIRNWKIKSCWVDGEMFLTHPKVWYHRVLNHSFWQILEQVWKVWQSCILVFHTHLSLRYRKMGICSFFTNYLMFLSLFYFTFNDTGNLIETWHYLYS